jgi:flagellar basal-body rod protein FlgB
MSDGFTTLQRLISAAGFRNQVLSSNIANVDTPGYKARDVKFEQILGAEMKLAITSPNHLGGAEPGSASTLTAAEAQAWVDENTVELDQEVAKMTENSMLYQAGVSMLAVKIKMFKNALKG